MFASDDGKIRLATKMRYAIVKEGTILITRTAPEVPEIVTPEEQSSSEKQTTSKEQTTKKTSMTKKQFLKNCPVVKVKSATKKKSSKKVKVILKKTVKQADGYIVCIYKKKNDAKKNKNTYVKSIVTKNKVNIKVAHNYLKKKKTLYVRVCAYKIIQNKMIVSKKWSKVKKIKLKNK